MDLDALARRLSPPKDTECKLTPHWRPHRLMSNSFNRYHARLHASEELVYSGYQWNRGTEESTNPHGVPTLLALTLFYPFPILYIFLALLKRDTASFG